MAVKIPRVVTFPTPENPDKKLYFDNNLVEDQMLRYRWTGCTSVALRDKIMKNTEELIRQIIRAHNLHRIYPGQEESAFGDLFQTAWVQIERTLYKYRARPHCAGCYNAMRPMDSCLYDQPEEEYDIISPEAIVRDKLTCKNKDCKNYLKIPDEIIYRGRSKIFNMWCVRPDTMISTTNGINQIRNVVTRVGYDDKQEIWTFGQNGPSKINAAIYKPQTGILDIKTAYDYEIGCTPEHGLMAMKDKIGWIKAGDLAVGDLLGFKYGHNFFVGDDDISDIDIETGGDWHDIPSKLTDDLCYILGAYVAEGSYTAGQLVIYNTDLDLIDRIMANALGLRFVHDKNRQCVYTSNLRFIEFVNKLGFTKCKADTKFIPQRIMQCSRVNMISFLRGLFDGDGHSSKHNGQVGFTSTSKLLIDQVRMILLNFGILTKLSYDRRTESTFNRSGKKYTCKKKLAYQLTCSTSQSKIFYNEIGFGIVRKQNKLINLPSIREYIFGLNTRFRSLYNKYGCGKAGYNKIKTIIQPDRCKCLVSTAVALVDNWSDYSSDPNFQFIKDRLSEFHGINGIKTVWLPINSISKSESEVCEISVASDDHSYLANSFISHNSQVARTVILAYIKKENRDHKNSDSYRTHLGVKHSVSTSYIFERFLSEARHICKYNKNYISILVALEKIVAEDDRPYEGMIGKLVTNSGQSRAQVSNFLKLLRLRCDEFTDSPINEKLNRYSMAESDDE